MTIDKAVMMTAGVVCMIGFVLGAVVNPLWHWLSAFIAFMLVFGPVTGLCPMAYLFRAMGIQPGKAFFCDKGACCCKTEK